MVFVWSQFYFDLCNIPCFPCLICVIYVFCIMFLLLQGMRKHKLLREDILPAMASNRKVQRLLNEFMDLISEYESAEINIETKTHTSPTPAHSSPADPMDSAPSGTHEIDSVPVATDQTKPVPPSTDQKDSSQLATDRENSAPPANYKVNSDPPKIILVSHTPQNAGS